MPLLRRLAATLLLFAATALVPGAAPAADKPAAEKPVADKPVVVFVPGFMGSELYDGAEQLWPQSDPKKHVADFERLIVPDGPAAPDDGVVARRVARSYDAFLAELAEVATVVPFPYDWRRSNFDSAAALDRFLADNATTRATASVTLVAHSMGGLVAMLLAQDAEGRFAQAGKVDRIVTMGTPYLGSVQTVVIAFRDSGLLPHGGVTGSNLQAAMNSFPSAYEMLPSYLDGPDGLACCIDEASSGAPPRRLPLWTWQGWSSLAWDPASYRRDAVQRALARGATGLRRAGESWRRSRPDWLFPIAGLSDLKPGAPGGTGLEGTTSLAFLSLGGHIDAGKPGRCGGPSLTCAYGDQVVAQFSATLGQADGLPGHHGGTCSLRLGQGPNGPYYHGDIVDDPAVRSSVLAALGAASNAEDWCRP